MKYKLPAQLGGGEFDGHPMDDGDWIVVSVVGHEVALPGAMLTLVEDEQEGEPTPLEVKDFNGRRSLHIERAQHGAQARLYVREGEAFGRAAILDPDGTERAGWALVRLARELRGA